MGSDWAGMTAAALGAGIGRGEIDPVALAEHFLDAIAAHPKAARIYARTTPERARAEAAGAADRARRGLRRHPLDGVPVSWKDLYDTAGIATEAGSALLKGRIPARDAVVLETATRAGLVCLGKTHMTELAFSGVGLNPVTATPPNVNDPNAVPGGSSSGAAASVAFGLAPAGIGSDTGGSIRLPSAWNDLTGFKPTHGVLSLEGVVPLASGYDTVGPLCRSVEDAALLFSALGGTKPVDLTGADLSGLRLAVLDSVALDEVREAPLRAFESALGRFAARGARVERLVQPGVAEALALSGALITAEAWAEWGELIETRPEVMFPVILDRFRLGRDISAATHIRAARRLSVLRREHAAAVAGFDAVLLPSSAILPPDAARMLADPAFFAAENLLGLRNTRIGNLLGAGAISLPTGVPSCGVMAFGLAGRDGALLRTAAAMEAALR